MSDLAERIMAEIREASDPEREAQLRRCGRTCSGGGRSRLLSYCGTPPRSCRKV